ncbi:16048_t:CDS:2 [Dentiscutata erythropus]|uniref:16048_t:CDS:1 n=1 Tax=Dentiscutata erythropus TaxID=1348616 RepID=A0A9N9FY86_9GLOM|nr:16048_t:CDS:2 [Dentiscutata erythropus]
MCNDIATAINCDASRITMPTLYQYSNEYNNGDQIFMRVNIAQGDGQSASSLASKLSETIVYKNISEISNSTILNYIDQSNGAWLMSNLWDNYKFFLIGIFVGLALLGILWYFACRRNYSGFGRAIKRKHAITNFFTIFLSTLIVVDLILDILFIVFHGKDEKWIMLVSITFLVAPIGFCTLFSFIIIGRELEEDRYRKWWQTHSRTALVTTLLSWFDVEALNVASSRTTSIGSLNAPYSPDAYRRIFYATTFILIIEDVPQLIFLTIYQNATIIPTIGPILALSSCRALILIRIISIIYLGFLHVREWRYMDEILNDEPDKEEKLIGKYTENQVMDLPSDEGHFQTRRTQYVDEESITQIREVQIYAPGTITTTCEENIYIQGDAPDRPQIQTRQDNTEAFDIEECSNPAGIKKQGREKNLEIKKYECNKNEQLTKWKIDKDLVYVNSERSIRFAGFADICDDYLGFHLLPNDDLIVIAINCIVIFTFDEDIKDEIQIIYYINIDTFMNTQQNFIDKKPESDIAQHLRKMIIMYLDDIHTFSCCSPFIMESIVKYDKKRKYRKHDNEIISLIIDKCINYYNEDNRRFDVLRAITSSISKLQKLYPYLVTKFFIGTSIFSSADKKIDYVPNSHLDGSRVEFPVELNIELIILSAAGYLAY